MVNEKIISLKQNETDKYTKIRKNQAHARVAPIKIPFATWFNFFWYCAT